MANENETVDDAIIEAPIEGEGTAEAVVSKPKRIKKNQTEVKIDPSNPSSCEDYLSEFYANAAALPPRKGYDQHWNKEGFIHAGPALRLPNRGAANMITFLFDILADRATGDDAAAAAEAKAYIDLLVNFGSNRIATVREQKNADILAKAREIEAQQKSAS